MYFKHKLFSFMSHFVASFFSMDDFNYIDAIFLNQDPAEPLRFDSYLERDHNYTMNIYQRDFMPGVTIIQNIADAIKNSRRCIFFLTR